MKKHRSRKQCEKLAPRLLRSIHQLRQAGLARGDRRHVALHPQQRLRMKVLCG
jgi:hypothetical protein